MRQPQEPVPHGLSFARPLNHRSWLILGLPLWPDHLHAQRGVLSSGLTPLGLLQYLTPQTDGPSVKSSLVDSVEYLTHAECWE